MVIPLHFSTKCEHGFVNAVSEQDVSKQVAKLQQEYNAQLVEVYRDDKGKKELLFKL